MLWAREKSWQISTWVCESGTPRRRRPGKRLEIISVKMAIKPTSAGCLRKGHTWRRRPGAQCLQIGERHRPGREEARGRSQGGGGSGRARGSQASHAVTHGPCCPQRTGRGAGARVASAGGLGAPAGEAFVPEEAARPAAPPACPSSCSHGQLWAARFPQDTISSAGHTVNVILTFIIHILSKYRWDACCVHSILFGLKKIKDSPGSLSLPRGLESGSWRKKAPPLHPETTGH